MERKIFKTDALENEFREKGYVVIPLLEKEQLKTLQEAFYDSKPSDQKGFHSTSTNNNLEYRKSVNDLIQSIYYPLSQQYIEDYDPIYASFVVKEPGQEGNFPLHMDWSMVDERNYISLAFWSPLVDTNTNNGPLIVLEGSHQLGLSFRGGPFLFQALNDGKISSNKFKTQTLFLKAGEVVIYDHRLFHGSLPNLTHDTRPALNFTMKPKEAKLLHYHQNENEIETHFVDKYFFNQYMMGDQPKDYLQTNFSCNDMLFLNDQLIAKLVK
ncbi:MAG TPA: phytanoyl-CoA dioxygenase family protein [Chitinophagales bacterium]|nr:phytanoyl-CoA dioxygenase family protein [Chitinophagales bacterium]